MNAAVVIVGTRADAALLEVGARSFERFLPYAKRYTVMVDAFPGDDVAAGAEHLGPWKFLGFAQLADLAYTRTADELIDTLCPIVIAPVLARGHDRVLIFRAGAVAVAEPAALLAQLEESDVAADAAFEIGWWGAKTGASRTVRRLHPDAEMIRYERIAHGAASTACIVVFGSLPVLAERDVVDAFGGGDVALRSALARVARELADANERYRATPYRFGRFSNGVPFDSIARGVLREALAAGYHFDDPGDAVASPSFCDWLRSPARDGTKLSRYLDRFLSLRPALAKRFRNAAHNPEALVAHLRLERPPDVAAIWYEDADRRGRDPAFASTAINVIGYFRSELGLGEAVRSLARALRWAGADASLVDFSDGSSNRQADTTFSEFGSNSSADIALLCANPEQYAALIRHPAGDVFGRAAYRIGMWWFELPALPRGWLPLFSSVHELWAGSHFVETTVGRDTTVPVTYVPPIVQSVPVGRDNRGRFRLARDEFLFLFMFDYRSSFARKNPDGVIRAFRQAFSGRRDRVRLLIKTINAEADADACARLHEIGADEPRVTFIDGYFDRASNQMLLSACDVYVSLHRAEGFGLTIAEAMAYGKPVIVTGWSGNLDFTDQTNSFLIRASPIEIDADHGAYYRGGIWAEPDIAEAADAMLRVFEDRPEAARRGARARLTIASSFNPARVGAIVWRRVSQISHRAWSLA